MLSAAETVPLGARCCWVSLAVGDATRRCGHGPVGMRMAWMVRTGMADGCCITESQVGCTGGALYGCSGEHCLMHGVHSAFGHMGTDAALQYTVAIGPLQPFLGSSSGPRWAPPGKKIAPG